MLTLHYPDRISIPEILSHDWTKEDDELGDFEDLGSLSRKEMMNSITGGL